MTNYEKYKEELLKMAAVSGWGVPKDTNKPQLCNEVGCSDCIFNNNGIGCIKAKAAWLDKGYVEKTVGNCSECEYFYCADGFVDTGVCSTPYFEQFVVHTDDVACEHAKPREQEEEE